MLGRYHEAGEAEIRLAIQAALDAKEAWSATPWEERAAIFNRMASLISTRYRCILNAATMLNQSKTAHQAEIDSTCETADFFRYNAKFMEQIYHHQPLSNAHTWNRVDYRPWKASCWRCRLSTSLPSAPTWPRHRRSWAIRWCGSRPPPPSFPTTT